MGPNLRAESILSVGIVHRPPFPYHPACLRRPPEYPLSLWTAPCANLNRLGPASSPALGPSSPVVFLALRRLVSSHLTPFLLHADTTLSWPLLGQPRKSHCQQRPVDLRRAAHFFGAADIRIPFAPLITTLSPCQHRPRQDVLIRPYSAPRRWRRRRCQHRRRSKQCRFKNQFLQQRQRQWTRDELRE